MNGLYVGCKIDTMFFGASFNRHSKMLSTKVFDEVVGPTINIELKLVA